MYLPNDFFFSFKHASYEKNIGDAIQISNSSSLTVDSLASWQFEAWSVGKENESFSMDRFHICKKSPLWPVLDKLKHNCTESE